ncbi:MAG: ASKHA domain-containing protein [Peptococcaceae bacterium]|nr:ASKHA domain-containing protein [Peptococcaceae bacterium]
MDQCNVRFLPDNLTVQVSSATTILLAAGKAGIQLKSGCGGKGTCGACKVILVSGEVEVESTGNLSREKIDAGVHLACKTKIMGDITVEVPLESRLAEHQVLMGSANGLLSEKEINLLSQYGLTPLARKISVHLPEPSLTENGADWPKLNIELKKHLGEGKIDIPLGVLRQLPDALRVGKWQVTATLVELNDRYELVNVEPGEQVNPPYGLAIDIGTTTVVVYLVNLATGAIIDKQGTYNKQARYGDDVITRIVYAVDAPGNLAEIQAAIIGTINELVDSLCTKYQVKPEEIVGAVAAGNTTMTQLFLGVSPKYVRLEPYIPTMNSVPPLRAADLGLHMNPHGAVLNFPSVASYVGGDIVSGALVTDMSNGDDLILFIDIGTNGEIVLGNRDWMVACACSAGPCFEGGGITFGMRAMPGAIERVEIDAQTFDVTFKVVGGKQPIGICGSGLVDCLAKLREAGIIDRAGNFQKDLQTPRYRQTHEDKEFVLAWAHQTPGDKDIVITENDVKNLIRAKGAIYAGIRSLLRMVSLEVEMIEKIVIAGGFGNYLNVKDSVQIGLLPDLPVEKYDFIGNSSVKGAHLALLSRAAWKEAEELGKKMTYLELSAGNDFMDEFVSALFLPHTDLSLFPTVEG